MRFRLKAGLQTGNFKHALKRVLRKKAHCNAGGPNTNTKAGWLMALAHPLLTKQAKAELLSAWFNGGVV